MDHKQPKNIRNETSVLWDDEQMWMDIEQELDKDRRRKIIIWFWPMLFLGASIIGFYYFMNQNSDPQQNTSTNSSVQVAKKGHIAAQLSQEEITNGVRKFPTQETSGLDTIINHNNISKTSAVKNTSITKDAIGKPYTKALTSSSQKPSMPNSLPSQNATDQNLVLNSPSDKPITSRSLLSDLEPLRLSSFQITKPVSEPKLEIGSESLVNALQKEQLSVVPQPFSIFDVSLGALKLNHNDGDRPWQMRLRESEIASSHLQLTWMGARPISEKWYFAGGIHYSSMRSRLITQDISERIEVVRVDTADIINSVAVPGEETRLSTTTTSYNVANSYNQISLPFAFIYKIENQNYQIMLDAGMSFNVYTILKGYTISPDNNVINFDALSMSRRTNVTLGNMSLGANFGKSLSENFVATLGIKYYKSLTDLYLSLIHI